MRVFIFVGKIFFVRILGLCKCSLKFMQIYANVAWNFFDDVKSLSGIIILKFLVSQEVNGITNICFCSMAFVLFKVMLM